MQGPKREALSLALCRCPAIGRNPLIRRDPAWSLGDPNLQEQTADHLSQPLRSSLQRWLSPSQTTCGSGNSASSGMPARQPRSGRPDALRSSSHKPQRRPGVQIMGLPLDGGCHYRHHASKLHRRGLLWPQERARRRKYTILGERQTLKRIGRDRAERSTPKTTAEMRTLDWAR